MTHCGGTLRLLDVALPLVADKTSPSNAQAHHRWTTGFMAVAVIAIVLQGGLLFLALFEPGLPYIVSNPRGDALDSEQFQRTLTLLEEIKFDVVHIQGFSPRPRTTAARQPDDIEPQEKKRRINVLLAAQRRIAEEANRRWLGRTVEVLVERAEGDEISGRSRQNKVGIGHAPLGADVGTVRLVKVEDATAWQLRGQVLTS